MQEPVQYLSYKIYRDGRVWSDVSGRFIKHCMSGFGYPHVGMQHNGKGIKRFVHRLIAECYLPKVDGKSCVNHIDGNKANFSIENLEWVTHAENIRKGHAAGYGRTAPKRLVIRPKWSDGRNELLRQMWSTGAYTMRELGDSLNMSKTGIQSRLRKMGLAA